MKQFLIFVSILVAIAATGFYFSLASAAGPAFLYAQGGTGSSTIPARSQVFYAGSTAWQSVATGTLSGTSNQIAVSATAYTLLNGATLSFPSRLIFPLSFESTYGTTTYASSTALTATNLFATNATLGSGTGLALLTAGAVGTYAGTNPCSASQALLSLNSSGVGSCVALTAGTVTSITAGLGLSGGTISTTGTINLLSYIATSTAETQGQLGYWTTTSGTPAKLSSVATSSIAVSAGLTNSGTLGSQVGGSSLTLKQVENRGFSYATSTAWTGTTTIQLGVGYGEAWQNMKCYTDVGTLNVDFSHASTHFQFFNASTTIGIVNMANTTNTTGDKVQVAIGTPASSPTVISCTLNDIN